MAHQSDQGIDTINVNVADLVVTAESHMLTSYGLGSCVVVAMYDTLEKAGGLAHVMLPESKGDAGERMPGKFADTAVPHMVEQLKALGVGRNRIRCKIAGGSQMFSIPGAKSRNKALGGNDVKHIGERNVEAVKEALKKVGIRLVAEDTGGDYGRSVRFNPHTGLMEIRTIEREEKAL